MARKTLILRIGTQRTGSRYIESLLNHVQPQLSEFGIWHPRESYGFGSHLMTDGHADVPVDVEHGLITYEGFVGKPQLAFRDTPKAIKQLQEFCSRWEKVRIVLFLRHQVEFIESWWALPSQWAGRKSFGKFVLGFPVFDFDWHRVATAWDDAFDSMLVHWQAKITGDNFMSLLGFDCDITTTLAGVRHARSKAACGQGFEAAEKEKLVNHYRDSNELLGKRYGLWID